MTVGEVVAFIDRFAAVASAPVRTQTTVTSVRPADDGYHVATSDGEFRCRRVVIASGACNVAAACPACPRRRAAVDRARSRRSTTAIPEQLPEGGVLVVGASATGVQLADEIHRPGGP